MPKVSVIIPTRNRCELLGHAVESARNAGSDVEVIVVDDASEDATPDVCADLSTRGLIHYIRTSRRLGVGGARNAALLSSTAPYISFLDDDDRRLPGSLDKQIRRLEAQPDAGMIYGQTFYGDENGHATNDFYPEHCPEGDLLWELLRWNFIPCPAVVFRRSCLTRIGMLEEEASGIEDWDLWVRIAELYPVIAMQEPVAIWRRPNPSSRQFTSQGDKLHRKARRLHSEKWLRLPRALAGTNAQRRAAARDFAARASQQLIWEAASHLKANHLPGFARIAFAGARMYPVGVSKKILTLKTWKFLASRLKAETR